MASQPNVLGVSRDLLTYEEHAQALLLAALGFFLGDIDRAFLAFCLAGLAMGFFTFGDSIFFLSRRMADICRCILFRGSPGPCRASACHGYVP